MSCPFCPIEKKTECYFHDQENEIVACRDLDNKGYKYRILVVGSGSKWHRPWGKYTDQEKSLLVDIANRIAQAHISQGKATSIACIDTKHFSIPSHGHVQACVK